MAELILLAVAGGAILFGPRRVLKTILGSWILIILVVIGVILGTASTDGRQGGADKANELISVLEKARCALIQESPFPHRWREDYPECFGGQP